jgi:16S rRNA (adenine1518-N6/adenine1519-N6)-dimethyltransferase
MGSGPARTDPPHQTPYSFGVARALRELAARHGVRPRKALGQHFLVDSNLARSIVRWAEVAPGDRVLEVGAGLGSLTVELAATAARVVAVEVDPAATSALRDVTRDHGNIDVVVGDALTLDWDSVLGADDWKMVSNLPYNVAVPLLMDMLKAAPQVRDFTVMVQREVGERLVAGPGDEQYGAVSVRAAYHTERRLIRRVPPSVFWPEPNVDSVIVRLIRRSPPVPTPRDLLFRVVDAGFSQRRKTMRNALVRMGLEASAARAALAECGLGANARAEELDLPAFACLAEAVRGR